MSKTIGQGTFGKVKLAVHGPTGERVAIKILEKNKIKDSSDIERVSREIKIMKKLSHPNIAQLFEVIETAEQILMVLEYASGGELFDYIVARGKLAESTSVRYFHQILNAVEYIHFNKVVHRDLKPENLLLDENNNIKLADFGLSNCYDDGRTLDTPCGSPCYAAPEMVAGKSYSGLSVDIWSCGIVLYAMICGFLPFEDNNTPVLYQKIIKGEYEEPAWLSHSAKDLLRHILDTNPGTRYSIDNIRRHPWMKETPSPSVYNGNIDQKVVKLMEGHGVDFSKAKNNLECNLKNSVTTLYYLLLKKNKSIAPQPQPPSSSSSRRIQKMQGIRHIEAKRCDSRPTSRIKVVAKSVSPKTSSENRSQTRISSGIRKFIVPKEPEVKPKTPIRRSHRNYKPVSPTRNNLNLSYKNTPRNMEASYKVKYPTSLFSP